MSNPDPTGFFAGQADPEHLPPPVAGGGGDGSSGGTQAQRGKNKSFKDITAAGREQDDHPTGLASPSKPRTGRKPDPSAANVTHPCPECDRQFWSQKALFGHMRCHPERQWRGINPPPHLRHPQPPTSATPCPLPTPGGQGRLPETEREVATCLVMMANGPTPGDAQGLTAEAAGAMDATPPPLSLLLAPVNCRFECSSCKKVFGSHQALGGHRASHKNVKGCFAIARSEGDEASGVSSGNNDTGDDGRTAGEGTVVMGLEQHRCRVCSRAFSSGQALGAHKRRRCERGDEQGAFCSALRSHVPDLNLPPPMEHCGSSYDPVLDLKLGI